MLTRQALSHRAIYQAKRILMHINNIYEIILINIKNLEVIEQCLSTNTEVSDDTRGGLD